MSAISDHQATIGHASLGGDRVSGGNDKYYKFQLRGHIGMPTSIKPGGYNVYRSFYENNWSSLNTVYDQMCSATGEKKRLRWDSSLGIVVDGLPINMTGNAKSSSEKAENVCRNYHALRFDASHRVVQKDEVVVAALDSYNACKAIEARTGVLVTHKFAAGFAGSEFRFQEFHHRSPYRWCAGHKYGVPLERSSAWT